MDTTLDTPVSAPTSSMQVMSDMDMPYPQYTDAFQAVDNGYPAGIQGYSQQSLQPQNTHLQDNPFPGVNEHQSTGEHVPGHSSDQQGECTGCANHEDCAMFKPFTGPDSDSKDVPLAKRASSNFVAANPQSRSVHSAGDSPDTTAVNDQIKSEHHDSPESSEMSPPGLAYPSTSALEGIKRYNDTPIFKATKKSSRLVTSTNSRDCIGELNMQPEENGNVGGAKYNSNAMSSPHSGLSLLMDSSKSNPDDSDLDLDDETNYNLRDNPMKEMTLDDFLHKSPTNKRQEFNNAVATELYPLKKKLFSSKRAFQNYLAEQQKWRWDFYQAYVDVATRTNNTLYKPSSGFAQNCARFTKMPENPRGEDVRRCEATSKVLEEIASKIADLRIELLKRKGAAIYNDTGEARFQPCPSELKFLEQIFDETDKLYQGVLNMMSNVSKTWEKLQNLFSEEQVEKANRQRVLRRRRENLRKKKKRALISLEKAALKLVARIAPVGMGHTKRKRVVEEIHLMELNKLSSKRDAEMLQYLVEKGYFVGQAEQVIIGKIRMLEVICGCSVTNPGVSGGGGTATAEQVAPPSATPSTSGKKKKSKKRKSSKRATQALSAALQVGGPSVGDAEGGRSIVTASTHTCTSEPVAMSGAGSPFIETRPVVSGVGPQTSQVSPAGNEAWAAGMQVSGVGTLASGAGPLVSGAGPPGSGAGPWVTQTGPVGASRSEMGPVMSQAWKTLPKVGVSSDLEASIPIGVRAMVGNSQGQWGVKKEHTTRDHPSEHRASETGPNVPGPWSAGLETPTEMKHTYAVSSVERPRLPVVESLVPGALVSKTESSAELGNFLTGVSPLLTRPPFDGAGPFGPFVSDARPLAGMMPGAASSRMPVFLDNVGGPSRTVPLVTGAMPLVPGIARTAPVATANLPGVTWTMPTAATSIPGGAIPGMAPAWAPPGGPVQPPTTASPSVPGVSRSFTHTFATTT